MPNWPPIAEPELLKRLAMDDAEFAEFVRALLSKMPSRAFEETIYERALAYPWTRPEESFHLTDEGVELLEDLTAADQDRVLHRLTSGGSDRLPVLAIGSNGAPETLGNKFAHFPDQNDREVLALTGRLHDFDVGVAAQPTMYGAMPATLFPSPGTEVCATVLWVTPTQFTQLAWSELTYHLGELRTPFEIDVGDTSFGEVLVFVSRFGAFCVEGQPVALAAVPAGGRTADALTQEQMLDAAARLSIGPGAKAETLVRAIFEELSEIAPKFAATVNKESLPFASDRWTPFNPAIRH